ncbi:uncharacterized protein EHS24_005715 [Apiotrichum porosum]|uniref:Uncharacterized protein n=1 Tax=Apiotrichum porosum TaxID=105984 RepID=A0A427XZ98_9TREE|nr:uncharacterized protein EHS24_005715 [Apiotrichum porosum]RSH84206.1 hypothetical protein EHS24_005715 [Apiotrichum porosum]
MAPYDRAPMEWVGKLNATGSYDLFVPCVNCNTGLPLPVAKDLDAFNAQRSKIRQQHKRRWMDDASEGGEAKKAKVDGSVDGSRPNKVDGFEGSKMNQRMPRTTPRLQQTRTPEEVETLLAKARAVAKKSSERV